MGHDFVPVDFPAFITWFIPVLISLPLSVLWSTSSIKKIWKKWQDGMGIGFGVSAGVGAFLWIVMYIFWSTSVFVYWRHGFGQVSYNVYIATLIISMLSVFLSFFWQIFFIGGPGYKWIVGAGFSALATVCAVGSVIVMGISVGQKHTPDVLIASLVLMIFYCLMLFGMTVALVIMAIYRASALKDFVSGIAGGLGMSAAPWNGRQTQFNSVPTQMNLNKQTISNRSPISSYRRND